MARSALQYLFRNPLRAAGAIAADPLEAWALLVDRIVWWHEMHNTRPRCRYEDHADPDWERRLHDILGLPWPCPAASEFWALWPQVVKSLETRGVRVGPEGFLGWNDGDTAFVRAIWCLTRHLRPENAVETGVAHGVTSRFILEAMEKNGAGHLSSVDRPPLDPAWRSHVGLAVDDDHRHRWSYVAGSSRRRLPGVLRKLPPIDFFVHDSLHSERNLAFELDLAWASLRPGGAVVVDDIDVNWAFWSFTRAHAEHPSLICESEPLRPDTRRFNKKGLFGIILKEPVAAGAR
jgi:Methyltransferase domain